ncbi:PilZ domain-containing protein [Desulfobacter postgatei]|uniref:PilZ domain-containing protein n=1 Tax=Desulfobacter postgatei TaxID=2293 RepID=UPI002A3630EB|nr:PilZ domain-containing protein [Desulfobacter postgatei]MDX9964366.1 PilZ domain-containing protein [Desulfobacter postgatei]
MSPYSEQRKYIRVDCNNPAYVYRYEDQDLYYNASMYNYSSGGHYLASDEKMDIGQQVYIRIKNYDQASKGPEKYENYTGYVKWSTDLGTSHPAGRYGYGIEYAEPIYY